MHQQLAMQQFVLEEGKKECQSDSRQFTIYFISKMSSHVFALFLEPIRFQTRLRLKLVI